MFIDQARISVKAGSGGKGCTSFFQTNKVRRGKANGGDGGDGGNIVIRASIGIQTLLDYHYNRHFKAERGQNGGSNNKTGRRGEDLVINVPCGTVIKNSINGLLLRDLVNNGDSVILAKGGGGGRGNSRGRPADAGSPGEEMEITFELKLIADVGIIGFPNAGKSTFISKVSSAKSKIADYPFTTKRPILGIVRYFENTLTFADMPGLIEGAHEGKGLGDKFLRHIERTRILLHMVDVSECGRNTPYQDYETISRELALYGNVLTKKKRIVALNKMDMPGAEKNAELMRKKLDIELFEISAVTGQGIRKLLDRIFSAV